VGEFVVLQRAYFDSDCVKTGLRLDSLAELIRDARLL